MTAGNKINILRTGIVNLLVRAKAFQELLPTYDINLATIYLLSCIMHDVLWAGALIQLSGQSLLHLECKAGLWVLIVLGRVSRVISVSGCCITFGSGSTPPGSATLVSSLDWLLLFK